MTYKFIVDESTGDRVAEQLRNEGFDVVSVISQMRGLDDLLIIERALEEQRIIITNDKDFGDLIFHQNFKPRGVLLLRLEDESTLNKLRVIRMIIHQYLKILEGNFVVVTERKIRKRPIKD